MMDEFSANQLFLKIKGKKITTNYWDTKSYFIPTTLVEDNSSWYMQGTALSYGHSYERCRYPLTPSSSRWRLYYCFEDELEGL